MGRQLMTSLNFCNFDPPSLSSHFSLLRPFYVLLTLFSFQSELLEMSMARSLVNSPFPEYRCRCFVCQGITTSSSNTFLMMSGCCRMILIAESFAVGLFPVSGWPVMLHTLGGNLFEYGSARSSANAGFPLLVADGFSESALVINFNDQIWSNFYQCVSRIYASLTWFNLWF